MADIIVNTDKLRTYADQLGKINKRIVTLDWRIKSLYTQVGLFDLISLTKADSLVNFNFRILGSQQYLLTTAGLFEGTETKLLKQDPTNFNKPAISGWQEAVWDVGHAVKTGCEKIKSKVVQTVDYLVDSYYSYGWVYDAVQYGKAALKIAKGVGKIASGVGSIFGTGGLSTPIAVMTIISGANDIFNGARDIHYVAQDEYDLVGKQNLLKDTMGTVGGFVGKALGNEELGEAIGKVTYYGIDIVTSVAALDCALDKLKQVTPTNLSQLGSELSELGSTNVADFFSTGISGFKYQVKLASYAYAETTNIISNTGVLIEVAGEAYGVTTGGVEAISTLFGKEDYKDPGLEAIKPIIKGAKTTSKVVKFIFG